MNPTSIRPVNQSEGLQQQADSKESPERRIPIQSNCVLLHRAIHWQSRNQTSYFMMEFADNRGAHVQTGTQP